MTRVWLFNFLVASLLLFPAVARGDDRAPIVEVLSSGKNQLLVRVAQSISGDRGWRRRVEIVVPRRKAVVSAANIISYNSATEFNNGDSSYQSSPPQFGFLLFANDPSGATLEIRLVDLLDKREFAASSINGIYHFAYPGD
jgi:hypothetical protein